MDGSIGDHAHVPGAALDVVFSAERLHPPLGGAERATLESAAAVASAGHRVRCLALAVPEERSTPAPAADLGWRELPQPGSPYHSRDWRARVARGQAVGEGLRRALAERMADVVVTHGPAVPAVARAASAEGVPVLVCLHGYESLCHWRFVLGSTCIPESGCRACPRTLALHGAEREARVAHADGQRKALHGASQLIAPSQAVAEATRETCGRLPEVIAPVVAAPARVEADLDGPVLAVSSLWSAEKGAALLAPIARGLGSGRRLVVQAGDAGRQIPLPAGLTDLPNVEVRTRRAEISELLPGASVLVVPSQMPDPWARVAFEGMAAGVPVLASDVGGLRESVPTAQRVSPHDDAGAWGEALERLREPDTWRAARDAGRRAAVQILATRPAERFVRAVESAATAG